MLKSTNIAIIVVVMLATAATARGRSEKPQHGNRTSRSALYSKLNSTKNFSIESVEKPAINRTDVPVRPKFVLSRTASFSLEADYTCTSATDAVCTNKTRLFATKILAEFRRSLGDGGTATPVDPNIYKVHYRRRGRVKSAACLVLGAGVRTLRRKDPPFDRHAIGVRMPKRKLFGQQRKALNSCAVVSSAGSLWKSNLGAFIDLHDVVMRFNHAPVEGYETDVGTKTTIRIVNSQVVSKPEFKFVTSPIFQNISIAAWDPGRYNATLQEWLTKPDFDLFTNYWRTLADRPHADLHLIDPRSVWKLWEALQDHTDTVAIRRNPPSSGFIGIALLLPICAYVDVLEFVPSTRLNGRCHYYDEEINPSCTFGAWHPLAAEKLMTLAMNSADLFTVYQRGVVRIQRPDKRRQRC